jgi:hypothetical protein
VLRECLASLCALVAMVCIFALLALFWLVDVAGIKETDFLAGVLKHPTYGPPFIACCVALAVSGIGFKLLTWNDKDSAATNVPVMMQEKKDKHGTD